VIAALLVAAAAFLAPPGPAGRVVVAFVPGVAWQAPGAAVGGLVTGDDPGREIDRLTGAVAVLDLTGAASLDAAIAEAHANPYDHLVLLSVPRAGQLGGIAVYPGNGVLRGTTRRDGLVTVADVTAYATGERDLATSAGGRADVERLDRQLRLQRTYHGFWATGLIALPMLLYIWLVFGRRRAGRVERRIALVLAAYPVAGFLSSLWPWWRASVPWLAATAAVAAATALACLAGVGAGRLLNAPPEAGVAAVTAAVLTADLLTGGHLQQTGVASYSALAGGRFYGLGNVGFAVLATAAVVALDAASRRYGPRVWLALVPLIAVVAWLGADFGGAVTLTAVLVVALATRARRTAVVLGTAGGLAVAMGVAALDYARESPTHLGRFVGEVLHGGWTDTVSRKAAAAAHTVLTWYPLLVVGSAVMAYALLRRCPRRIRPYVVLLVLGSLVNDSGLVVAAAGLAVAVPLLLSYAEQP
jgi:hypothetical protein